MTRSGGNSENRQHVRARRLSTIGVVLLCASDGASLLYGFLIQPGMEHFHVPASEYLLWFSITTIAGAVFYPIAGRMMRRFGVRRMTLLGGATVVCAFVGMGLATDVIWLYILAVPVGVGWTCTNALSSNTLIVGWYPPERRGTVIGISYSALGLAGIVYGAVYPPIIAVGGYTGGMLVLAGLIVVLVIANALVLIRDPPRVDDIDGHPVQGAATTTATIRSPGYNPAMMVAIVFLAIGGLGLGLEATFGTVLPAAFVSFGVDPTTAGLFLSAGSAVSMFATPVMGWISDRWGVYTALAVGAFGYVVGDAGAALLVPHAHWLGFIFVPLSLCLGSFSTSLVVLPQAVDRAVGVARFPMVHSIALAALQVGVAVGAWLWGTISDATGSFLYGLYLSAVTGLIGVAGCAIAVMVTRKERITYTASPAPR